MGRALPQDGFHRAHTQMLIRVISHPAILMAGLAEVSRIGDTLLNHLLGRGPNRSSSRLTFP